MKKIFSFVFAVALTTSLWATTYTPQPGENTIKAVVDGGLQDGDVIELANGSYTEWSTLTFTTKVTIKAAENAQVSLGIYDLKIQNDFEINGINIHNISKDNYLFHLNAAVAGTVAFKNCTMAVSTEEITTPTPYIYVETTGQGTMIIDRCTFSGNTKSQGAVVYAGSNTITNFTMTNSTVYDCPIQSVYCEKITNALVDQCTFYNNAGQILYIKGTLTSCVVKNCIFSAATSITDNCIKTYGGSVENCIYYNLSGPRDGVTTNNCKKADPLFVDAANANFQLKLTSPAVNFGTEGQTIGDPRWGVAEPVVTTIPDTLKAGDAVLSSGASVVDGAIKFTGVDDWAKWSIKVEEAAFFDVVVDANNKYGHNITVGVYNAQDELVASVTEGGNKYTAGTPIALAIGSLSLEPGQYTVKYSNATSGSDVKVIDICFNYGGGAEVNVPGTLPAADAVMVGGTFRNAAGQIQQSGKKDQSADYAWWNINATKAGDVDVTVNVGAGCDKGHRYTVALYNSDDELVSSVAETADSWDDGARALGLMNIPAAGTYTVRLSNSVNYSGAFVDNIMLAYLGGAEMAIPGQLPGEEALLAGKMIRLENGSFQWPNKSDVDSHYATWNVTVADEGDVDIYAYIGTPSSGHCFTAALYDGDELISSVSEAKTVHTTGEVKLGTISINDAGTYTIRLTNAQAWSTTIVDSLVVKEAEEAIEITLDEDDTENAALTTYLDQTVNVNLTRSMPVGMFSTICLPFGASKQGQFVGAKIYYLDSTYIKGDEVILCFKENSDFYQGIPYIIEPATAVNNPRFENVVIKEPTAGKTEKEHAIFQGTYFKKHLEAGNENLLFLGQNNTLYFPKDGDTESMMGLRAYFEIKQEPGAPIRRASIKMGTDVVTTLDLVDGQAIPNGKFMLNGQIVIRANGQDYMLNGMQK